MFTWKNKQPSKIETMYIDTTSHKAVKLRLWSIMVTDNVKPLTQIKNTNVYSSNKTFTVKNTGYPTRWHKFAKGKCNVLTCYSRFFKGLFLDIKQTLFN